VETKNGPRRGKTITLPKHPRTITVSGVRAAKDPPRRKRMLVWLIAHRIEQALVTLHDCREDCFTMIKDSANRSQTTAINDPDTVEQRIRRRAYELYEQRGREDGHDVDDWIHAEEEVRKKTTRIVAA
jgi:hypothetical protein